MAKSRLLNKGDVIKTSPVKGYWGCALVLSSREKTAKFGPTCHIAVTPLVFRHDYEFDELDPSTFKVLEQDVDIRTGPCQHAHLRHEVCIGIYSRKVASDVAVIGNVNVSPVFSGDLKFVAGDSTDGGWPICGEVTPNLGYQAVHAWRAVNDREQWLRDTAEAKKSHEGMLQRSKKKGA